MAFFENRMVVISNGMSIGKLRTAINVELLPAFDAMALTIDRMVAKPALPSIIARKYMG